jgi:hypothetical protein
MDRERKPPAPLESSVADDTDAEEGEHAPSRGKPGEDLTEISEEDD